MVSKPIILSMLLAIVLGEEFKDLIMRKKYNLVRRLNVEEEEEETAS